MSIADNLLDGNQKGVITAQNVMPMLRCANADCNNAIGQAHFFGSGGVFRIFNCSKCGEGSEFTNTPQGIQVKVIPAKKQSRLQAVPESKESKR